MKNRIKYFFFFFFLNIHNSEEGWDLRILKYERSQRGSSFTGHKSFVSKGPLSIPSSSNGWGMYCPCYSDGGFPAVPRPSNVKRFLLETVGGISGRVSVNSYSSSGQKSQVVVIKDVGVRT